MRAFIAVSLSMSQQAALASYQRQLAALHGSQSLRWLNPDSFHLTLNFLGDINANQIDSLEEIVESVAAQYTATTLIMNRLTVLPQSDQPKVLASCSCQENPVLNELQKQLTANLRMQRFRVAKQGFLAHVSLARFKQPYLPELDVLDDLAVDVTVDNITLFESHLSKTGSRYDALFTVPLINVKNPEHAEKLS